MELGPTEMAMMFREIDEIEALPETQRKVARTLIDSGAITHIGYRRWQLAENRQELLAKYLEEHPE